MASAPAAPHGAAAQIRGEAVQLLGLERRAEQIAVQRQHLPADPRPGGLAGEMRGTFGFNREGLAALS